VVAGAPPDVVVVAGGVVAVEAAVVVFALVWVELAVEEEEVLDVPVV
jgi:hypothetical protein